MTTATLRMYSALSQDMALQRSFALDKDSIMRAFGLSSAERATVKSADHNQIKKLLGEPQPICFVLGLTRSSKGE